MASVFDVAAYILKERGEMTAWKLQKLVYYAQAWSLVWDEEPLFDQQIEAWANGPVVRELFDVHKGCFKVAPASFLSGKPENLSRSQKETVDAVIRDYGDYSSQYLSDLTHMEAPWKEARQGVPDGAPSTNVITLDSMARFYESIRTE